MSVTQLVGGNLVEIGITSINGSVTNSTQEVVLPLPDLFFDGKDSRPCQERTDIFVLPQKILFDIGWGICQVRRSIFERLYHFWLIDIDSFISVIIAWKI